jgi:hypothetical protein
MTICGWIGVTSGIAYTDKTCGVSITDSSSGSLVLAKPSLTPHVLCVPHMSTWKVFDSKAEHFPPALPRHFLPHFLSPCLIAAAFTPDGFARRPITPSTPLGERMPLQKDCV